MPAENGSLMTPDDLTGQFSLFLDVDGTLIDIAPHPNAVVVAPSLIRDLALADRQLGGGLALVSGRTIEDLDRLFHPLRLRASGVHGAEFRFDPLGAVEPSGPVLPNEAWQDLLGLLEAFPGTLAENKAFSFAVHYRAKPEVRPFLEAALLNLLSRRQDLGLRLMPGHYVFELKSPEINKGAAIARFLHQDAFRGRRPIFLGDDVTDRAGFDKVVAHGGLAFAVGIVVPGVSGTFPNPSAVRAWLSALTGPKIPSA